MAETRDNGYRHDKLLEKKKECSVYCARWNVRCILWWRIIIIIIIIILGCFTWPTKLFPVPRPRNA